jgi:uracil-DNA glycosylase
MQISNDSPAKIEKPAHEVLAPFTGWSGPRNPRLLIIGEAWGENEYQTRQPFVGTSGIELWRMLGEALPDIAPSLHAASLREAYNLGPPWIRGRETWLNASSIAFTNVLNLRPPANKIESLCCAKSALPAGYSAPSLAKGLYLRPEYLPEIARLLEELDIARPNCILAAGNTACWALLHTTNISAIRGAVTHSIVAPITKVLPTFHPAAILRQWSWRPITVADIIKGYREAQSPELVRPERQVLINPEMHELISWRDWILGEGRPELLAVDVETQWQQIKCIGFAWHRSAAISIPFAKSPGPHYWDTKADEINAWKVVRDVLESSVPKLFQNGLYDLQYILRWGMRPANLAHDTMLLHHSLYPELRKGLGFLGSVYSNEAAWKLMGRPKADTVKRDE